VEIQYGGTCDLIRRYALTLRGLD